MSINAAIAFALILVATAALSSGSPAPREAAAAPSGPGSTARVSPEVRQTLDEHNTARVLVALREPRALRSLPLDVSRLQVEVAAAQASVLAAIGPGDFALTYRYLAVPGLAGEVTSKGLAALEQHRDVAAITLDGLGSAAMTTSVPLIHADEVHIAGVTGQGIVVAVLDTGIDTNHPDFAGRILYESCFLATGQCPGGAHPAEDDNGHGTNVAGIAAGGGTVAPTGVAPGVQIAAYKILNANANGNLSDWVAALDDIIANHPEVDLVNMSLQSDAGCFGGPMETAVSMLRQLGVATFIATGNHGRKNSFTIPACIEEGLSVGASYDTDIGPFNWSSVCIDPSTAADQVACWSDSADSIDLLGPGALITAAGMGGGTSTYRGTSQATPHALGVAALMLSVTPGLSVDELEARLEATGKLLTDDLDDNVPTTFRTTPRIDARVALLTGGDDADGDGCLTSEELGADPILGGLRNPLNPWDFYDVTGDGAVNLLDDVLAVVAAFGPADGEHYDAALDRSPPPPGAFPWDLGPPDGMITIVDDIIAVTAQFGHHCSGAP